MFEKNKRIKLKGKAIITLNNQIFERDDCKCVICGRFVSPEEKFHHEPCGAKKSDEINKGVVLCFDCHQKRHFSKELSIKFKKKIEKYLYKIYQSI